MNRSNINDAKIVENYLCWLEHFTEIDPEFEDDKYLYISKNKDEERGNASKLGQFYQIINNYKKMKGINPEVNSYQEYHTIRYHDVDYKIGFMEGQETVYFCKRLKEKTKIKILEK